MSALPFEHRLTIPVAASIVGIAVSWLVQTPYGLLVPAVSLFLLVSDRAIPLRLLFGASAIGLAIALTLVLTETTANTAASTWSAFFVLVPCLGAIAVSAPRNKSGLSDTDESGVERQAEQTLHKSERYLRQMIDAVPVSIWCAAPDGTPIYRNKRHADATGAILTDMVTDEGYASPLQAMAHPDDFEAAEKVRFRAFTSGTSYVVRYRQIRDDGSYRWTESRAEPLRDEAGTILRWYGVSIDIHDMVVAQEALRDRERELSQLVDMVPVHIRRLTPGGETIFLNKRLVDFIGMDLSELSKRGATGLTEAVKTLIHPDDVSDVQAIIRHSLAAGEPYATKYRLRRADGAFRWVEGRGEPLRDQSGAIVQWYGISIDIHDEVVAQDAVKQSERRFQQMIDAVPVHILSFSAEGEPTYINKRYRDYLGLSIPHYPTLREQQRAIIHPDDFDAMYCTLAKSFQTGEPFLLRYRRRGKDGLYRWTEGRAEPLRDQDGTIVQWYAVSLDIDDEVHAQAALRQSERSLRQLVETLPAMIYCATPDGEPTYRSRQLRDFLGFNVDERHDVEGSRLGGTLDFVVHPDELAAVKRRYAHSLSTGEPYALRHRLRRADGVFRWVETRAAPMRDADGNIVQWNGICLDIEDEVRAQDQLRLAQETLARASQAASLAELSASIAHEVNQPLAAVIFNSNACQRWLKSEPPNLERAQVTVDRIIRDANSAADVVSRIRALFRQSIESRGVAEIKDVVAEARELMAQEAARRSLRLHVQIDDAIPPLEVDRVQVQQVLVNLLRNGMEAMAAHGSGKDLEIRVRHPDDFVRIEVRDHGPGLDPSEKIFEPFVTTKANGMGMGLAICRSIVESHGGRLWVEKNEPRGAVFLFTLPTAAKAAG